MAPPTLYVYNTLFPDRHRTGNNGACSSLMVYQLVYVYACKLVDSFKAVLVLTKTTKIQQCGHQWTWRYINITQVTQLQIILTAQNILSFQKLDVQRLANTCQMRWLFLKLFTYGFCKRDYITRTSKLSSGFPLKCWDKKSWLFQDFSILDIPKIMTYFSTISGLKQQSW